MNQLASQLSSTLDIDQLSAGGVLDAIPDGVYITDTDRRIVFWNRAAETITGWDRERVVGCHCADNILCHIDKDGHLLCGKERCPLHRSMVTGVRSASSMLLFAQSASGTRVPVEASVAPLFDQDQRIVGGVEVFRDMTATMSDLNRARLIQQRSLVPDTLPGEPLQIASYYVPHDLVGGDFFRFEKIDEDHYALLVADVTGHGISAALYTMQLRTLWEEHREELAHPAEFMASLNVGLHALASGEDHFATAIVAVIDSKSGLVRYARAGHEPPFHIDVEGELTLLTQRGAGLGLLPNSSYIVAEFTLQPGETFLIYSDGAIELDSAEGDELRVAGLRKMVATVDFSKGGRALTELGESLLKYSNDIRLPDDLTLVSVYRPLRTPA